MRILGIDPSVRYTGFGIIQCSQNSCEVETFGVIKPFSHQSFPYKINQIKNRIEELITQYRPEEVAVESLFYAQNIKTAITLGQARGAALIAVASQNCSLFEYSPLEIKKAITGYGQADKNQVKFMIRSLLHIQNEKIPTDASDALAAALCHAHSRIYHQTLRKNLQRNKKNK
ncbi:crossover junction endodeoxyribonuclease RuvC [bacterium]|nr:crossover junction endodeoxyribonuclease RuvC [bacterium]